jgi:hypothetical protein
LLDRRGESSSAATDELWRADSIAYANNHCPAFSTATSVEARNNGHAASTECDKNSATTDKQTDCDRQMGILLSRFLSII